MLNFKYWGMALLWVFAVKAAAEVPAVETIVPSLSVGQRAITRTFEDLGPPRLKLTGVANAYVFSIPVSPREKVTGGTMHLETTNSTALIQRRSEIAVSVNGRVLTQYQLDPVKTRAVHDINLPLELLVPGYNEVRISVVQHYTNDCENPTSPELWTLIDGKRSTVTLNIEGQVPNLAPRLPQLSTLFDRRGWLPRNLTIVSGSDFVTEQEVSAAAMAVQGLAVRMDYRPLQTSVLTYAEAYSAAGGNPRFPYLSAKAFQTSDVLLVGKRAELSRYWGTEFQAFATGPFVGVFPANQGDSAVLVITGDTDEDLYQAARSLANVDYKFTDKAVEQVSPLKLPVAQNLLTPGEPVLLEGLGLKTQTLSMARNPVTSVEFRAPGYFAAKKDAFSALQLHLSYSAALRNLSTLDVYLNGTFVQSVLLEDPKGKDFIMTVKVPSQLVQPGQNVLMFEAKLATATEECDRDAYARGVLTVFGDSQFTLSEPNAVPKTPDLQRYSRSFWPQDDQLQVMLTSRRAEVVGAALELLAFAAQKNRASLETRVSFSLPATGHYTIIGPYEGLPDSVHKVWPLNKYQWTAEGSQVAVLQAVEAKRVLTGFFARDPQALRGAVNHMRNLNFWRELAGTSVIIGTADESIQIDGLAAPAQDIGYDRKVARDWRVSLAIKVALITIVAIMAALYLRRRIKRRSPA